MKYLLLLMGLLAVLPWQVEAAIPPEAVAILYNTSSPDSVKLAETYQKARHIPKDNVIGLEMSTTQDITRENYDLTILQPLRSEFEHRGWWMRQTENQVIVPISNKIQVLVTMRGVPLRIKPTPKPPDALKDPLHGHDEASVDSELSMFGVEGVPIDAVLQNKYYKADKPFAEAKMPFLVLTARIDAPTLSICERMIRDAVEAESTGLWGRAYVDIANKFPLGDKWLEEVVIANLDAGIPTVVDRFNETLPKNYPMTDCSIYYGWYDSSINGPFLNTHFQFRKGAVAMHLHSFSAEQLSNSSKNWSGGLLAGGAAVTVGNVYEPYLHLTHDFGIIQRKLLEGYTWGESCWMAMPVTSWQGVVLGDPLYQPFRRLDGSGTKHEPDIEYRALRAAAVQWKSEPTERQYQIGNAVKRMKSGVLAEALGLELAERKSYTRAANLFLSAKSLYTKPEDQLRQVFNLASLESAAGHRDFAILALRDARPDFATLPEAVALDEWLKILAPALPSVPSADGKGKTSDK